MLPLRASKAKNIELRFDSKYERVLQGSRDGAAVRALASHQCGPGSISRLSVMWVESVVGSRPCSMKFFSGYSGFPLSLKTNISKF